MRAGERILDSTFAIALAAVTTASVLTHNPSYADAQPDRNVWLALAAVSSGLLLAARRAAPVAVFCTVLALHSAVDAYGWKPELIGVCLLVAMYTVAARRPIPVSGACTAACYAADGFVSLVQDDAAYPGNVVEQAVFALAWVAGVSVRRGRAQQQRSRERALAVERDRARAVQHAVAAEQMRILRELHDVITHALSEIAVQAGVARHLALTRPESSGPALEAIASAGRVALGDLRRMLGLLRTPADTAIGEDPAPADLGRTAPTAPGTRDQLVDLAVGAALAAVSVGSVVSVDPDSAYDYPPPDYRIVLLALASSLPLVVRRRYPSTAFVIILAAVGIVSALSWNTGVLPFCLMVALFTVSARRERHHAAAALAATALTMVGLAILRVPYFDHPLALISGGALIATWAIGRYARRQTLAVERARAEERAAEHRKAAAAERAVLDERLRVARELHDVVAHTLSVIAVQAGVASHLADTAPERTASALQVVEAAARTAMTDLRRMVSVLPGDTAPELAPAPGLDELRLLASAHRASHGPVDLDVDPEVEKAPDSLRLTVFRIVQESLTNARKHAPGTPVTARVRMAEEGVVVTVGNPGPVRAGGEPGFGLAGMRERVALFDGRLDAGTQPDGGFRVRALLRWEHDREAG